MSKSGLAVRGKLVEQDPKDEPAAELLKQIQAEKARLVKAGQIKESKPLATIKTDETSYEIPANWKWVALGETVNSHLGGGTPSKSNSAYWDGNIYWASVKDVGKGKYVDAAIDRITDAGLADSSSNLIPPGNLIVVTRMGLGKVSINRVPIAINQDLRALSLSSLSAIDYYYIFFKTHGFKGTGLTVKGIKVEELLNIAFPLPPLAEQQRIVAKVDELMALCDRLEVAQAERESRRDRLGAASLNRLFDGADTDSFREHARFHLRHLPRLTNRPEHIQWLRQTILNLAVRGRLIPQDLNDEPASELLKRIQAEKARLEAERICKKSKLLPSMREDEKPFVLPLGWEWSRLRSLVFALGDGLHGTPTYVDGTKFYFINGNNLVHGKIVIKPSTKTVSFDEMQKHKKPMSSNTVLVSINGTLGNVAFYNNEQVVLGKSACYFNLSECIDKHFVRLVIESKYFVDYALRNATGTTIRNLSLKAMNELPVPLPALAEQHRIVAKVNELMALCDRLETQLTTAKTGCRFLLEAILHEALSDSLELEQLVAA